MLWICACRSKNPREDDYNYMQIGGTEQCALTLEVNDFYSLYNQMKKNGTYVSDVEDNGSCGLNFCAYDPDGNKIDIWSGWPR